MPIAAAQLEPIGAALLRWCLGVEADAAQALDSAGRNFEGDVKGSLFARVDGAGAGRFTGTIGAASAHARYTHEGRRPGKQPPIVAIQPWVEKKLGVPRERARSVAFLVARKIGRRGTRGTPFLREPFEAALPRLGPALSAAAEQAVASAFPPRTL